MASVDKLRTLGTASSRTSLDRRLGDGAVGTPGRRPELDQADVAERPRSARTGWPHDAGSRVRDRSRANASLAVTAYATLTRWVVDRVPKRIFQAWRAAVRYSLMDTGMDEATPNRWRDAYRQAPPRIASR